MKKYQKIQVLLIHFLIQVPNLLALLALPTDDLLGPEVCPTGAFCSDTSLCTHSYYKTKNGLPFYCGPQQQIDSKVCCIETDAVTKLNSIDKNDLGLEVDVDDEVDILSVPYATNPADDVEIIYFDEQNSPQSTRDERPHGKLESILEDAIEEELNFTSSSVPNIRETGFKPNDAVPLQQHNFEPAFFEQKMHFHDQSVEEPLRHPSPVDPNLNFVEFEHPGYSEARTSHKLDNQKQTVFSSCPCEKGEKGDKGEPGEPGKIIYIPVFVNSGPATTGVPPVQFSSYQPQGNQPNFGQIPQHPNPTVVPYNVPVNLPPTNPSSTPSATANAAQTPQQQHSYSSPHLQQAYQTTIPQAQPTFPATPSTALPSNDDLRARLSRHTQTQVQMKDQRFVNRRH